MTRGGDNKLERTDVERIVRQVLAELSRGTAGLGRAERSEVELVVEHAVVSLADVQGKLTGVTRLVVGRGAVITPAARDELNKHKVAIASRVSQPTDKSVGAKLLLGSAETNYESTWLVAALRKERVEIEQLPHVGLTGVLDELCEAIFKGGQRGVLLTSQAAAAVCLANRHHGVRCVLATSVRGTAEAVDAVGANLLIVDPDGRSVFELRSLVRQLARAAALCPPRWKDRLG